MIYGAKVFLNHKHISKNSKFAAGKVEEPFSFLQENLGEFNDDMLKMMPLLKNLSK
jgi:hypothetical protein